MAKPVYKILSAQPGEPSILWLGKSGREYRTLVAAKRDKASEAYQTGNITQAIQASTGMDTQTLVFAVVIIVVVAFVGYKIIS